MTVFNIKKKEGISYNITDETTVGKTSVYTFEFSWNKNNADANDTVEIVWSVPQNDLLYEWTPVSFLEHFLPTDYSEFNNSMISYNAPTTVLFNGKSEHKYSWAISECSKLVYFKTGVREQDGLVYINIKIPLKQYTNCFKTTFKIRIDCETKSFSDGIKGIAAWWEGELKTPPLSVPDAAKDALYSFWYSYHRDFNAEIIEKECKLAAELGFKSTIIDDGWQTNNGGWEGYEICGDWNVGLSKFPDMKKHISNVHKLGMKYIMWYSVPFMGTKCSRYTEFEGMFLRRYSANVGILDPRYKRVRDFLIDIYKTAVSDWDLDGLKLDFIDRWCEDETNAPYSDEMDIPALQDAVDRFMTDVALELKQIKPDILIEFRQDYVGPNMRRFGNMFRVKDCPDDYIKNRVGVLDLRLLMGNSAVHSDMLMWHKDESHELVAVQIISVLFGVLQYSAKIGELSDESVKTSKFWLNFMAEHKDLLLNSNITVYEPHLLYTWAKTSNDTECALAVYSVDKCVKPDFKDVIYVANGSEEKRVFVELEGKYVADIFNCLGEKTSSNEILTKGVNILNIPVGGLAVLNKKL